MHGNTKKLKELWQNWKSRIRMFWDYLINRLYLQKINLKKPLSKGSHFKIYFRLECRGNRGSRQNFHGIPFSKDRLLINPNRYLMIQKLLWHTYIENQTVWIKHEKKKIREILIYSYPKIRHRSIFLLVISFPFFMFFL